MPILELVNENANRVFPTIKLNDRSALKRLESSFNFVFNVSYEDVQLCLAFEQPPELFFCDSLVIVTLLT